MQNDLDPKGLLPCPFCGGPAKEPMLYNGAMETGCAGPHECPGTDVLVPIAAWNRRHLSATVPARCRITGNLVGTDTVRKGYQCPCSACSPATVPAGDGELAALLAKVNNGRPVIERESDGVVFIQREVCIEAMSALAASRLSQGTGDNEPGWVEIIEQSLTPDGGVALTLQLDGEEATVVAHFGGSNG